MEGGADDEGNEESPDLRSENQSLNDDPDEMEHGLLALDEGEAPRTSERDALA